MRCDPPPFMQLLKFTIALSQVASLELQERRVKVGRAEQRGGASDRRRHAGGSKRAVSRMT